MTRGGKTTGLARYSTNLVGAKEKENRVRERQKKKEKKERKKRQGNGNGIKYEKGNGGRRGGDCGWTIRRRFAKKLSLDVYFIFK